MYRSCREYKWIYWAFKSSRDVYFLFSTNVNISLHSKSGYCLYILKILFIQKVDKSMYCTLLAWHWLVHCAVDALRKGYWDVEMIRACCACWDECWVMIWPGMWVMTMRLTLFMMQIMFGSFLHCLYLVTLCGQLLHLCFISHQSAACSCVHDLFCHCDKVTRLIQTISWIVALVLPSNLRKIIPLTCYQSVQFSYQCINS